METATQTNLSDFDLQLMDPNTNEPPTFDIDEFNWCFEGFNVDAPTTTANDASFDERLGGGLVLEDWNTHHDIHMRLAQMDQMMERLENSVQQLSGRTEEIAGQVHKTVDAIECLRIGMAHFTKALADMLQPFFQSTKGDLEGNDQQA